MNFIRLFLVIFLIIQPLKIYAVEQEKVIECPETIDKNVLKMVGIYGSHTNIIKFPQVVLA